MKKIDKKEVIRTYKDKIQFKCPVRGMVEQEVEIKVYTPISAPSPILSAEEIEELLEQYEIDSDNY